MRMRDELWTAPTHVYWAYDSEGRVLYIGVTHDVELRMRWHRNWSTRWFKDCVRVESKTFPHRLAALAAEGAAIRRERPPWNLHVPGDVVLPPIVRRDELAAS